MHTLCRTRHDGSIHDDKKIIITHRLRASLALLCSAVTTFWWWRHNTMTRPDNCDASTWKVISNPLNVDPIHCDIQNCCVLITILWNCFPWTEQRTSHYLKYRWSGTLTHTDMQHSASINLILWMQKCQAVMMIIVGCVISHQECSATVCSNDVVGLELYVA